MVRLSVADDSYRHMTLAWSVVLREVEALPRTEQELAIMHWQAHIVPGQHGLDVRSTDRRAHSSGDVDRRDLCRCADRELFVIGGHRVRRYFGHADVG